MRELAEHTQEANRMHKEKEEELVAAVKKIGVLLFRFLVVVRFSHLWSEGETTKCMEDLESAEKRLQELSEQDAEREGGGTVQAVDWHPFGYLCCQSLLFRVHRQLFACESVKEREGGNRAFIEQSACGEAPASLG